MKVSDRLYQNRQFFLHLLFWVLAFTLLTYIYGTAYNSFRLGLFVILTLLPVHIAYYYAINRLVLPQFFKNKYLQGVATGLLIMFSIAVCYRLVEIFITDQIIYSFLRKQDPGFIWPRIAQSWWVQLKSGEDFVNAIERSNVIVWIGITLKLFALWHERKNVILQAELAALKGQLHPHFLFNSLNNLYALSLKGSTQTPDVILGLSNILRYVIYECAADRVSLARDVEVLKDYIALEKLRYEERLDLNLNMDEGLNHWEIAPLLMLPLVENAFKHGAGETVDSPWINIEIKIVDEALILKISNSKPEYDSNDRMLSGGKIGLANVRHRLELLYPGQHSLEWFDEEGCFILEMKVKLIPRKQN